VCFIGFIKVVVPNNRGITQWLPKEKTGRYCELRVTHCLMVMLGCSILHHSQVILTISSFYCHRFLKNKNNKSLFVTTTNTPHRFSFVDLDKQATLQNHSQFPQLPFPIFPLTEKHYPIKF